MSRTRWEGVIEEARSRFGSEPFTVLELVDVLRPYVNPMEAARKADRLRVPAKPPEYETRRKDEVSVGLSLMARQMLTNRVRSGGVESLGGGVYRFGRTSTLGTGR
jgi:hypothetical protein